MPNEIENYYQNNYSKNINSTRYKNKQKVNNLMNNEDFEPAVINERCDIPISMIAN